MNELKNIMSREINCETLSEYLRNKYHDRYLIFEDCPNLNLLSELIVELHIRGFSTIGDIQKTLDRTEQAAELFESDYPPNQLVDSHYSAVGIVRISMLLLDNDFFTFKPTVLDNCLPEKLAEYRKYILPEISE